MRKKTISKMSKADITKLRQEVESGEVTTREIANKWRINFSELMSWCKRLGLRYNTVKPKNDVPLPNIPQQKEVQAPVENIILEQKTKSAKEENVPKERISGTSEEYLTANNLWETLFEGVNTSMTVLDLSDLLNISISTIYRLFAKKNTISMYYEWCKLKGRPYVAFNHRKGDSRDFEMAVIQFLEEKDQDIIPKTIVESQYNESLMEVYDKNLNLTYAIDKNGRIVINEDVKDSYITINVKLPGRNNEALDALRVVAEQIAKDAQTVAKSREEYEIRKRLDVLNEERISLLNKLQDLQS